MLHGHLHELNCVLDETAIFFRLLVSPGTPNENENEQCDNNELNCSVDA